MPAFLRTDRRPVPGLPDHHVVLQQPVLGGVAGIPELLDPRLVREGNRQDLVVDLLHGVRVFVGVQHPVARQLAGMIEPQADAQQQRVRPPLNVALVFFVPQAAVGQRCVIERRLVGAPRDRLAAPAMRRVKQLAVPAPQPLADLRQLRQHVVERQLAFIERRQQAQFLELRRAVMRRLAQIEAFARGGLQLVDLLLVLAERRGADLDPGCLFEVGDQRVRLLVVPVQQRERA